MTRMKSVNESPDSSDLVVDLPKLQRNPGVPAEVASEWKPDLLETTHSSATLIQVKISLEAVSERITAIGTATLHWTAQCRRCLEATSGCTSIDINEIFEEGASEGETFELPLGEKLDLKPMLAENHGAGLQMDTLSGAGFKVLTEQLRAASQDDAILRAMARKASGWSA